ncbi:MAG: serine/threonine protein kinase [Lentisphaeria bacterium]|nr:serine/threonine protein kinase [Lentisphaeria bacterium]
MEKVDVVRFQCGECGGIVAIESSDMGSTVECGHCSKIVQSPETRVSPGSVIGDCIIRREIGRGGMGIVYEAHQISLDRPAALKILSEAYANNSEFVVGFIKEARAAAKLNHPHIVQAYAVGEDAGIFYLAMEYVDGETMKGFLKQNRIVEPLQAINIIQQIAEALSYAWSEQKLIHRDIKPDNIMLTSSGRAKLADLGLARVAGDVDDADKDEVMGTPQYICPEHLTGAPMDVRSDIYSLGATFYHFVTGRFAFEGSSAAEIAQKHITCPLTPAVEVNKDIPECVSMIISKMMEKNPLMRYPDADSLVDDLRAARKMVEAGCTTTKVTSLLRSKNPGDSSASAPRLFTPEADELVPASGLKALFTGKKKWLGISMVTAVVLAVAGVAAVIAKVQSQKNSAAAVPAAQAQAKSESALLKQIRAEIEYIETSKDPKADIYKRASTFIAQLPQKMTAEESALAKDLKAAAEKVKASIPKPLTKEQIAAQEKKKQEAAKKAAAAKAAAAKAAAAKKKPAPAPKKAAPAKKPAPAPKKAVPAKKPAPAPKKAVPAKKPAPAKSNIATQMTNEFIALFPKMYALTSKRIVVTNVKDKARYASEFAQAVKLFENFKQKWAAQAKKNPQIAGAVAAQNVKTNAALTLLKHCQAIHELAYKGGTDMKGVYIGKYRVLSTNWRGIDYLNTNNNFESRLKLADLNYGVKMRLITASARKLRKQNIMIDGVPLLAYYHILVGDTPISVSGMNLTTAQKQKLINYFKVCKLPAKEMQILNKKPAQPKKKATPAKKTATPAKKTATPAKKTATPAKKTAAKTTPAKKK